MKHTIKYLTVISILAVLAACAQTDFDNPGEKIGEKIEATTTIAQIKSYMTTSGVFSSDRISSSDDLIINGIVTSTDVSGNIYKYIVIQEEIPNGQAIRISVDASNLAAVYPLGQRVAVKLNNLCIGKYGSCPQIGIYYARPKDERVSPGAIPMPIAEKCIFPYGEVEPQAVVPETMTIAQILSADKQALNYKLIKIKNAFFTGKGADYNKPADIINAADKIFAPFTNGIGFPQSREIQDGTGSIFVSTSEYARFSKYPLPASNYVGDITAIVIWYNDRATTPPAAEIHHQLTLRSLNDLGAGFDGYKNQVNQ
jgi:hypothetical protein